MPWRGSATVLVTGHDPVRRWAGAILHRVIQPRLCVLVHDHAAIPAGAAPQQLYVRFEQGTDEREVVPWARFTVAQHERRAISAASWFTTARYQH